MKRIISKELFCRYINQIIDREEKANKLSNSLQEFADDSDFTGFFFNSDYEVEFLEKLLNDENRWISWWIYEGRENPEEMYINCNNKKWVIHNPEELYDFLFQDVEEETENKYFSGGKACIDEISKMILRTSETIEKTNNKELKNYFAIVVKALEELKENIKKKLYEETGAYIIENNKFNKEENAKS